jgi:hypothetical protein
VRRPATRELAALADGTLAAQKHATVMRHVRRSPRLSRALEQQRFAVELLRSLTDPAPARLRVWLERACSEASAGQPRQDAVR